MRVTLNSGSPLSGSHAISAPDAEYPYSYRSPGSHACSLQGDAAGALSATDHQRRRSSQRCWPLYRRYRHSVVLFPADGRPRGARRAEAEVDPGARHRRRQHRRPALARERGGGHKCSRHPRRRRCPRRPRLHALARPRHAALGARAGASQVGTLAVGTAGRQDRRHFRRGLDRRISGADLQDASA